jgi:hypothetical protein
MRRKKDVKANAVREITAPGDKERLRPVLQRRVTEKEVYRGSAE